MSASPASPHLIMRKPYYLWLVAFGLWLSVGLLLSAEVYFNLGATRAEVSFLEVAQAQYLRALVWAALTPLVLWLRVQVPPSTGRFVIGVGFHLAMSLLLMVAYYLGRTTFVLMAESPSGLFDFWSVALNSFIGRNLIDAAFYWLVLAGGYSADLYRRFKNEELKAAQLESRAIEAELQALKQQLQPHMLFNTLNTVAMLVREGRNDDAVTLLARLSTLLRMALDSTRIHEVTLRQELDFIERYIDIQKIRFNDRLAVQTRISHEALNARIPNLLLQPLVENAIVHGIAPRAAPGLVEVSARVETGRLHLQVRDNGRGFAMQDASGRPPRQGIGLTNTRERLAKIYGAACEFALSSAPGQGTTIRIVLPYRI